MPADTFAELRDRDIEKRCNGCGEVFADQPVRLNLGAAHNKPKTEWLYRKGATVCERCALRAIRGFLDALNDASGVD